jgi:hypothetical protein
MDSNTQRERVITYRADLEWVIEFALGPRGGLWSVHLFVIHKEGLCPSSGDINRLMMMIMIQLGVFLN